MSNIGGSLTDGYATPSSVPPSPRKIEAISRATTIYEIYNGERHLLPLSVESDGIHLGCTVVSLEAWRYLEENINALLKARR